MSTLTYWVRRLEPVIQAGSAEETIVVFANRCGTEDEATYAGSSTVLGIKDGEVSVYGILGRGVEELLVVDTAEPPMGKIIDRPQVPVEGEPGGQPAPAEGPEEGPPRRSNPSAGSGYVDSPTLPSGFTPHATNHTNLPPNHTARNERKPSAPPKRTPSGSRPKLSLQTNLSPAARPQLATSPTRIPVSNPLTLPASPPEETERAPPSAIPIFVDVYTPDEPTWRDDGDEDATVGFGLDDALALALSPWSVSTGRSAESSPSPSPWGCRATIRIAASPSVFAPSLLLSSPSLGRVCV